MRFIVPFICLSTLKDILKRTNGFSGASANADAGTSANAGANAGTGTGTGANDTFAAETRLYITPILTHV